MAGRRRRDSGWQDPATATGGRAAADRAGRSSALLPGGWRGAAAVTAAARPSHRDRWRRPAPPFRGGPVRPPDFAVETRGQPARLSQKTDRQSTKSASPRLTLPLSCAAGNVVERDKSRAGKASKVAPRSGAAKRRQLHSPMPLGEACVPREIPAPLPRCVSCAYGQQLRPATALEPSRPCCILVPAAS